MLLDDVRRWAQARGNQVFHFGGGRAGKDDSLMAFKARFSRRRHEFYLGRWILEADAYQSLCEQHRVYAQEAGRVSQGEGLLPQYRTPNRKIVWSMECEQRGLTPRLTFRLDSSVKIAVST